MEGIYTVRRRVRDLPHGYEFQPRKRIFRDHENYFGNGCYVEQTSIDGKEVSFAMTNSTYSTYQDTKIWLNGCDEISCVVDFVPSTHRGIWIQIQKLGKCYLSYDPVTDSWTVVFPENAILNFPSDHARSQSEAIDTLVYRYLKDSIIHNGYRWFDCRDVLAIQKISDDEAKKLQKEIAGT